MTGYRWRGQRPEGQLCACGCGEAAPIAKRTDCRYGAVKGQPRRYIVGHNPAGPGASTRAHGTRACYQAGCRLDECQAANRAYLQNRSRQMAYGRWDPFTDAEPARMHVKHLEETGMSWHRTAMFAGLHQNVIRRLLGLDASRPATRRLRRSASDAILGVRPGITQLPGTALVSSAGTHRRLQALMACGWSQRRLARQLGMGGQHFYSLMRRTRIQEATRLAVAGLYARLWNVPPPAVTPSARQWAERIRQAAADAGWPPPAAWDDEAIDDPDGRPAEAWHRPKGRGKSPEQRLPGQVRADEIRELIAFGVPQPAAAKRLEMSVDAMLKLLERYPAAAA